MRELTELHDSSLQALSTTYDAKFRTLSAEYNSLSARLEETLNNFTDKAESDILEVKSELSALSARVESAISDFNERVSAHGEQLSESIEKNTERLDSYSDRLADMNAKQKKYEKSLDLMSAKLQEFDNISVDIEDVEKSFITRDEMKDSLVSVKEREKAAKKTDKQLDRMARKLSDLEEDRHANREDLKSVMREIADLKNRLALKDDLDQMNERIDRFADMIEQSSTELEAVFKKIDSNVADVIALKKDFVTKEQFRDQRKEIKLLVQGLKDIQKIKQKLK